MKEDKLHHLCTTKGKFKQISETTKIYKGQNVGKRGIILLRQFGPFSLADVNEELYFRTYIDDYYRMKYTCLMQEKSQTINNISRYI